ncbi:hypothetical protein [Thermogemmatispora tikiterensis]|uniref:Uncharacterized protein n=1 Tax=Thermogemmatispora tikiterensis TaxID=1825093 RepID=A0A328VG02_9CHLR|nr:hypothetical protein [Thermogemmatispora tikiterensis]RAQ94234.1 hypothetical protein A4R35_01740 [Thermogemmatispora tikiterensis]
MDATEARKALDERKTGTAILSAQQLRWRESVAFDTDLTVSFEPAQLYEFNARLWSDPARLTALQERPDELLEAFGLAKATALLPENKVLENRQLTAEELAAMRQILLAASEQGLLSQEALELALNDEGYGLPAVAVVCVAVTVVTCMSLFIFLWLTGA